MSNWISTHISRIWDKVQEIAERLNHLVTILAQLSSILTKLDLLQTKLDWLTASQVAMVQSLTNIGAALEALAGMVEDILETLTPPPPVAFRVTIRAGKNEGEVMAKTAGATVDFRLEDDGTLTGTLTPIDAAGLPTNQPLPVGTSVPVWTPSGPGLTITPAADGMSAVVTPAVPPVLVTGATITVSATLASGAIITGVSDPIDVVGGPAVGFQIALQ